MLTSTCVVATSRSPPPVRNSARRSARNRRERLRAHHAARDRPAERGAALAQIRRSPRCPPAGDRTASPRGRRRRSGCRGDRGTRAARARRASSPGARCCGPRPSAPSAVALDGLGEDHRRRAAMRDRRGIGGVDLLGIVAAAAETLQLGVGQVLDQCQQARDRCRRSACGCRRPISTVYFWYSPSTTSPMRCTSRPSVSRASRSSQSSPQIDLDDVPAGAAEGGLELLDDLAVAAHGTVEALQVAVDDEDQVVELLARGERERAHALGLVHLAVAEERPDPAVARCRRARARAR